MERELRGVDRPRLGWAAGFTRGVFGLLEDRMNAAVLSERATRFLTRAKEPPAD